MDRSTITGERPERPERQSPAAEPPTDAAHAYYLENKAGFDAWNAYVAEHGLPLADLED